jgi:putative phosphoesterase
MSKQAVTVGILSDSHGYLDPRVAEAVNGCDYIIHAGDIFNAGVLDQLSPKKQLVAVTGNNDIPAVWHPEEHDRVKQLPCKAELELPGGLIIIEHGHRLGNRPDHEQLRWDHAEARMIVYGHTHHRVVDKNEQPWVVNPGASGRVRTHGGPSCLVLHASDQDWRLETYQFPEDSSYE